MTACSSSTPSASTGDLPAVANPTDQSVEPVISADSASPPSTDVIKNLVVGKGATATASDTVLVMYVGALYSTGADFDRSTWEAKMPTSFPLNEVVPGFAQGVEGMKVGGRREIVIPAALGYGANPPQGIPANATLVFVVDLKSVS
jgi:peptidylprolyl isomerase